MIRHYKGNLGEFNYDDDEFEIGLEESDHQWICYVGNGLTVNLPKGCIDTSYMFAYRKLPKGFVLGDDFDTSRVVQMEGMFEECKLPKGFSLGDKFNTSNVKSMSSMFEGCTMSEGFTLGDKFDTSNVENMNDMFFACSMPKGFTLGNKFCTSKVKDMRYMFDCCKLPKGFSLGDKFDTSNVEIMKDMFTNCIMSEGFSLGNKFDTSNVKNMTSMFEGCEFPRGFTLGDKFNTSNTKCMEGIFENSTISEDFMLCNKFIKMDSEALLFNKTKFPSRIKIDENTTEDDIIAQLKKPLDYNDCTKEFTKLIKEGKSLSEARKEIFNTFNFTTDTIEKVENDLKNKLNQACSSAIISLFSIKDTKEEHSEYTVGEVRDGLLRKGFPEETVMKSIVTYLENQVLV